MNRTVDSEQAPPQGAAQSDGAKTGALPAAANGGGDSQAGEAAFSLSAKGRALIQREARRYETKLSCLIPSLYQIQKEKSYVPMSAVPWLSAQTGIPASKIYEVLMFYTLFHKKPAGRFHVQVCRNVSCSMQGGRKLLQNLCKAFHVKEGEKSACGNWTFSSAECLGACDLAPVIQVGDRYFGNTDEEGAIAALRALQKESDKTKPPGE